MKNLNRKFRKALSVASLGALCCVQSVTVNSVNIDSDIEPIFSFSQQGRKNMFEDLKNHEVIVYKGKGLARSRGVEYTKSGKRQATLFPVCYMDVTKNKKVFFILLKDTETQNVYVLPHSTDLESLIKVSYSSFPPEFDPNVNPKNERKCWEKLDELIQCYTDYYTGKREAKENKKNGNGKGVDDYNMTKLQKGLLGLGILGVVGVGAVWATSKIIKSIGEAGGNIIHGTHSQTPAPTVIINSK